MRRYLALLLAVTLIQVIPAHAEDYASVNEARDAALLAMKNYQQGVKDCLDVMNAKNNLSTVEVSGIKLILEHSKTLLDECIAQDTYAVSSIKELTPDTGTNPLFTLETYSDYVTEFEAYLDTVQSTQDDVKNALPTLKSTANLLGTWGGALTEINSGITKFDNEFASYSADVKNLIQSSPSWTQYINFKAVYTSQKDKYDQALKELDGLDRLIDLEA